MDKKSKILIVLFALVMTASIVVTYYKYIILEDVTYYTDENAFQASLEEEE